MHPMLMCIMLLCCIKKDVGLNRLHTRTRTNNFCLPERNISRHMQATDPPGSSQRQLRLKCHLGLLRTEGVIRVGSDVDFACVALGVANQIVHATKNGDDLF